MNFLDAALGGDWGTGMMNGFRMGQMMRQQRLAEQKQKEDYELNRMLKEEQALKLKQQRNLMEEGEKIKQGFQPQTVMRSNETAMDYETGEQAPTTQSFTQEPALIKYARQVHGDEVADMALEMAKYGKHNEALALITKPPSKGEWLTVPEGGTAMNLKTREIVQGSPKTQRPVNVSPGGTLVDPTTGKPMYQNPAKPPTGYRFGNDGNMEPVPGGPADIKWQNAASQAFASMSNANESLNRLAQAANSLLNHKGLARITGIMGKLPNMPGSGAANAQALLENIKSQAGFAVLQNMRDMSKTGGALGQVSDFENKILQSNLAALDQAQSLPEFKKALKQILNYTKGAKGRIGKAYEQSYYGKRSQVNRTAEPPVSGARQAPDGNWYVSDPNRPGKYLRVE